jgi:hypothetical protein
MSEETELLTREELAIRLQLHPNTVARKEKEGVIQGVHIGTGTTRYILKDVVQDLKNQNPRQRLKK